jgi:methionyl-tRNA synthetase
VRGLLALIAFCGAGMVIVDVSRAQTAFSGTFTFGADGNFARSNLIARCNSELSNKIGNLLQRTASFVYKNCDRAVPNIPHDVIGRLYQEELLMLVLVRHAENITYMSNFQINKVLENIIYIAEQANLYIDQQAPWSLKNTDIERMNLVLYCLLELVRNIAIMLLPFTPDAAEKMLNQLGVPDNERSFDHLGYEYALKPEAGIQEPMPIFPRLI